jgi:hypothetical protein
MHGTIQQEIQLPIITLYWRIIKINASPSLPALQCRRCTRSNLSEIRPVRTVIKYPPPPLILPLFAFQQSRPYFQFMRSPWQEQNGRDTTRRQSYTGSQ